jgi:excisionase family DNA binding protein
MQKPLEVPHLPPDRLLPVHIAARRLDCSDRTLRRWIALRKVPAQRIGRRRWGIRLRDIERLRVTQSRRREHHLKWSRTDKEEGSHDGPTGRGEGTPNSNKTTVANTVGNKERGHD